MAIPSTGSTDAEANADSPKAVKLVLEPECLDELTYLAPLHTRTKYYSSAISYITLTLQQITSFVLSTFFLSLVVVPATISNIVTNIPSLFRHEHPAKLRDWDTECHRKEHVVRDVKYYARAVDLDIVEEEVVTEDGFILRMHRVVNPRHSPHPDGRGGFPVLLMHGLFQSSGSFITSEERSLAFWLSEVHGYQVFLGNTRGVFNMGHTKYDRSDPRFWDWTIYDLAKYDFPALVEWTCKTTGYDKCAVIAHSQGNGIGFVSLSKSVCPDIGKQISVFIALAPAVFAGPLTDGFMFKVLRTMNWTTWKFIFGTLDFIPLMRYSYDWVPSRIFAMFGYILFSHLFEWTDRNWLKRRKTKMFRFTPTPVSSASLFWWTGKGGFAEKKCIMNPASPQWFDENFPPLSIYHGGRDRLVLLPPLLERFKTHEPHVKLLRVEEIPLAEHCDGYWAQDAVEWCFGSFVEDIERTRTGYAEDII